MKRFFKRGVALLLAAQMLLVSCNGQSGATPSSSSTPDTSDIPDTSDAATSPLPDSSEVVPDSSEGKELPDIPETDRPSWMTDINEKIAAQSNEYGRSMSAALGGYSEKYANGSIEAMAEAIGYGVDAIAIYAKKTSDGVILAMTTSSLGDSTDILDKAGKDGLPYIWKPNAWTYEQVQKLRLKNADGTASDSTIPTLEEVVELCSGKCFIYIVNIDSCNDSYDKAFYELAEKYNAYSSFIVSPGADKLKDWSLAHPENTELAEFLNSVSGTHTSNGKYIAGRIPVSHTVSNWDIMWLGASDDAFGWKLAAASGLGFLLTKNLPTYTEWIAENFKSALEYQPSGSDAVTYSLNKEDLTGRYLFVSDLHYVMAERSGQVNRVQYRGFTNDQRMQELCKDIRYEYEVRGLDGVYVLGDLSTDDYYEGIEDKPKTGYAGNACKAVYDKFLKPLSEELGIPIYVMGGNHDSYSNEVWREFSGLDRQYTVDDGDNVFIVCDVYDPADGNDAKKDGNYANGSDYTGVNIAWLKSQLEKYKDRENVFIMSHYFDGGEFASLVKQYPNVVCLLDGHTHHQSSTRKLAGTDKIIINTGTYSYGSFEGDFGASCSCGNSGCLWGFQIIETTADSVVSYRIDTERRYYFSDGNIVYTPYTKYAEMLLKNTDTEN